MRSAMAYRSGKILEARGLDMVQSELWMMLLSDLYVFDGAHGRRSELSKYEITGPGYTSGGRPINGRTLNWNGDVLQVKAEDVLWPRASIRARYAVVYRARGGDPSQDELVNCQDFGDNVASMNGPFRVEWPEGVMRES